MTHISEIRPRSKYRLSYSRLRAKRNHPEYWRNLWTNRRWEQHRLGRNLCIKLSCQRARATHLQHLHVESEGK